MSTGRPAFFSTASAVDDDSNPRSPELPRVPETMTPASRSRAASTMADQMVVSDSTR